MPALHLLYVFPEPLPLARARGVQVAHFVHALANAGVRITLAYVPGEQGHPFSPIGREVPENVRLLPLSRQLPGFRIKSNYLFMFRLALWLRRQASADNLPDVAFFRHVKAAALFVRLFPSVPVIYEAHEVFSVTAKASQTERMHRLEALVLEQAAVVIANSDGTARGLAEVYGASRTISVLPNGVEFPETLPDKPWRESARHLVYAGSLFGWKGVDDLVDAMAYLPECHLRVIGGNTAQIERLQKRVAPEGGTIEFLGHRAQREVQSLLACSCVAILPNRPDPDSAYTSPLKLFEYMAAGCAVVATDLPAIRASLAEVAAASWAAPSDPAALAQAIRAVHTRPDGGCGLGVAGRAHVRSNTWGHRAHRLIDLIGERGLRCE